jgi:hypothetical protein
VSLLARLPRLTTLSYGMPYHCAIPEVQHAIMARTVACLPKLTHLRIDSSFQFVAVHIRTMVSALPALRVFSVWVGSLVSLECFISPHSCAMLRALSIDGGAACPRLPLSALEPLRALRMLEELVLRFVVIEPIPDAEWAQWRVDGPGPHAARAAQASLIYVDLAGRKSGSCTPRNRLPPVDCVG